MKNVLIKLGIVLYLIAAIIVSGHAFTTNKHYYTINGKKFDSTDQNMTGAFLCGVFWPAYISAKLWERQE